MQTFDDFLTDEMAQPVTVTNPKTKERTQLQPLRAMAIAVKNKAIQGDIQAIQFVRLMTQKQTTDGDKDHIAREQQRLTDTKAELADCLTRQQLPPDGYDTELELLARQMITLRRIAEATDMPRFQVIDIIPQKQGTDRHTLSETNRIWQDLHKQFLSDWQDLRNQIRQQMLMRKR